MSTLTIIFLGIIQGLTEFLPISSSGHLVIFQHVFGIKEGGLLINLVLHTGTLLAVIIFFFKEIISLFKTLNYKKNPTLYLILLANIPTAIIGLMIKKIYHDLSAIWVVGIMLLITGGFLLLIKRHQEGGREMNTKNASLIGGMQGLAVIPGISRSGSTIALGLLLNIKKELVFSFSFLISIPAILGADIIELIQINKTLGTSGIPIIGLIFGFISAFFIGYICLSFLKKLLITKKFHYFGYYCFLVGTGLIIGGII